MYMSAPSSPFTCRDKKRIALEIFDAHRDFDFARKVAFVKNVYPEFLAAHRGICMMALDPRADREDLVLLMDLQIERDEGRIDEDKMHAAFRKHMSDKMIRLHPELARKVVGDAQVNETLS